MNTRIFGERVNNDKPVPALELYRMVHVESAPGSFRQHPWLVYKPSVFILLLSTGRASPAKMLYDLVYVWPLHY